MADHRERRQKKMKIAVKAEVEADLVIAGPVIAKLYPYEFEIYKENDKLWLKVSKPVKEYEKYLPKVFCKNGTLNITIGAEDIFKDLIEWLQYIEAMGAFNIQIKRVYWDRPVFCWIAETDEEHLQTPLAEYNRTPKSGMTPKRLTEHNLSNIVIYRRQLQDIYIPFVYYKEGKRFFDNFNYYFAYINYFMMLEYCFADGKFHQKEVIKNFNNAQLLQLCILEFLTMPNLRKGDLIWDTLAKECVARHKKMDVDGVIYVLLALRGELSHASSKSQMRYRDDEELRPFVVVISTICFLLCGHLQIYGFTSEVSKKELIAQNIAKFSAMLGEKMRSM